MWTSPDGQYSTSNAEHAQQYAQRQADAANRAQFINNYRNTFTSNISELANSNAMRQIELPNGRMVDVWGYGGQNSGLYDVYDSNTGQLIAHGRVNDVADAVGNSLDGGSSGAAGGNQPKGDFMQRIMNNPAVATGMTLMAGYGIYKGFEALGQDFSVGGLVNSALGTLQFMSSAGGLLNRLLHTTHGNAYALAAVAAIAVVGLLMGKKKKGNQLDTTRGDVSGLANTTAPSTNTSNSTSGSTSTPSANRPRSWYQQLSSNNVFMITAASALMAIGLNLGLSGPSADSRLVKATELAGVRNALDASVGGGKLPSIATSALGKVFIQSSENNGLTPDKVVYVSQETMGDDKNPPTYSVNMLSLNYSGYMVSPNNPDASYVPVFYKNENGAVVANPLANAAMARTRALAQAAASNQTSPTGAAAAAAQSGANHN